MRATIISILFLSTLLTVGFAALPQQNSCSAPYWDDTLRCDAAQGQPPQENVDTSPANTGQLRSFTRVFLNGNPDVRCLDGTRPILYVDKAVCTEPTGCGTVPFGESVDSDEWIFSMSGGGSCHVDDDDGDGIEDNAQECLSLYIQGEASEMGTSHATPMTSLGGIHSADPVENPVFAGYNRVRIKKCSYDRYTGRQDYTAPGGYFSATVTSRAGVSTTIDFDLYQQGYHIMEEALFELRSGLTYTTWVAIEGSNAVTEVQEVLPPLEDADAILFAGHSGGAHGLMHNIDHLSDELSSWPAFSGDVRALFDAQFTPSLENEAAFAVGVSFTTTHDAYSDIWSGTTEALLQDFDYDGSAYFSQDPPLEPSTWRTAYDASCLAAHTGGEEWKCVDRYHVLMNHISTPFFVREDFTDPNRAHLLDGQGHVVLWTDDRNQYAHCPDPTSPCLPMLTPEEYRPRVERQAATFLGGFDFRSEMGGGVDQSLGGTGDVPTVLLWMPDCNSHAGIFNDAAYQETVIRTTGFSVSLREWLEEFMHFGRINVLGWRIDGWQDSSGQTMTSICPDE